MCDFLKKKLHIPEYATGGIIEKTMIDVKCDPPEFIVPAKITDAQMERLLSDLMGVPKRTEIKPCPFCGGEVEIVRIGGGWFWKHKGVFETWETDCPIQFNHKYETREKAIEAWNRRVNE